MLQQLTFKKATRNNPRQYSLDQQRRQRALERRHVPGLRKAIEAQFKDFINAINDKGFNYARHNIFKIVRIEPIVHVIKALYKDAAYVESGYVGSYIKRHHAAKRSTFGVTLNDLAPVIDNYFDIYLLKQSALPITAFTRDIIVRHLISEVDAGKDLQQAIKDFDDLAISGLNPISLSRAVTIARTESTKAMSLGGLIGAYMTGLDVDKMWVTCNDELVRGGRVYPNARFKHTHLDQNVTTLFEAFNNGEKIRFPGDPEASLENIINCRCTVLFLEKDDSFDDDVTRSIDNFLTDLNLNNGV